MIEKSTFRNNSAGIVPNGENPGDGPPPENGMCNAKKPHSPYHLFTSTNIARCTIFRENLVTENNNLEVPANPSTEKAPWGVGVELPGDMANLVENNTITNNVNNGVLGFEYPNPYPPEECTQELEEKGVCAKTIYFQLSGNKIADNTFMNNGTSGKQFASDITLQGGIYPHKKFTSDNNCVSGNSLTNITYPAEIENMWGCQNMTTPPPNNGFGCDRIPGDPLRRIGETAQSGGAAGAADAGNDARPVPGGARRTRCARRPLDSELRTGAAPREGGGAGASGAPPARASAAKRSPRSSKSRKRS